MKDTLYPGENLLPGQSLWSKNGKYELRYQPDGNLVIYEMGDRTVWSSNTRGKQAGRAAMQTDGHFVLYHPNNSPYWATGQYGFSGGRIVMQEDRNLVVYRSNNSPAWASNTHTYQAPLPARRDTLRAGENLMPGQSLWSKNGKYELRYQTNGDFILFEGTKALWGSVTPGRAAGRAAMQTDGHLCLYDVNNRYYWGNQVHGFSGGRLVVQDDRNLVVYRSNNSIAWHSNTKYVAPANKDTLNAGESLNPGESLWSKNGRYELRYQTNGDLILFEGTKALWGSVTPGIPAGKATLQPDGTLILFDNQNFPYWSSAKFSIALKASNGRYVSTENWGNSPLKASAPHIKEWETFEWVSMGGRNIALKAAVNGKYVCAENWGNSPLKASAPHTKQWETFEWISRGGNNMALKAAVNSKYVCNESNGSQALIASRTSIGGWESFQMSILSQSSGSRLTVQDDRNMVIYNSGNAPIWHSNTQATHSTPPSTPTAPPPFPRTNTLRAGQKLLAGQSIWSKNSKYELRYQTDGNLVLYESNKPYWASQTHGKSAGEARMQSDGHFCLYDPSGRYYWGTQVHGFSNGKIVIQDDRNLVIYRADNKPAWASNTHIDVSTPRNKDRLFVGEKLLPGQSIKSKNGRYELQFKKDGNLVLIEAGKDIAWQTDTAINSATVKSIGKMLNPVEAVMQENGQFVLYGIFEENFSFFGNTYKINQVKSYWATPKSGFNNGKLAIQNDRNLVVLDSNDYIKWQSKTRKITLDAGEALRPGESIFNPFLPGNKGDSYELRYQKDGNLVLFENGTNAIWETNTAGKPGEARMQPDGHFVLYDSGNRAIWMTNVYGYADSNDGKVALQDNGNILVAVINYKNKVYIEKWASDTDKNSRAAKETALAQKNTIGQAASFPSGFGTDSTPYLAPASGTPGSAAASKSYLKISSNNNYLTSPVNINESELTISMWFRTTHSNCGLISATDINGGGSDRHLYLKDGNLFTRVYKRGYLNTSGKNYADGKWHKVTFAMGRSIGGTKLYVDGVLEGSNTKSASDFTWQSQVSIGYSHDAQQRSFTGDLAEVAIWSKVLPEAELKDVSRLLTGNEADLQALWDFSSTSGTQALDLSGNGYHATLQSSTGFSWETSSDFPISGSSSSKACLKLGGANNFLTSPLNINESELTISMWFRTTHSNCGLISATDINGGGSDRHLYLKDGNLFTRVYKRGYLNTSGKNYADGKWHKVTFAIGRSIGGTKLYVDGALQGSNTKAASDFTWQSQVSIGYSHDAQQRSFTGDLAEVAIWSKVLPEAELKDVSRLLTGNEADLQALWDFSSTSGTQALDLSGNGYHATLQSSTGFSWETSSDFPISSGGGASIIQPPTETTTVQAETTALIQEKEANALGTGLEESVGDIQTYMDTPVDLSNGSSLQDLIASGKMPQFNLMQRLKGAISGNHLQIGSGQLGDFSDIASVASGLLSILPLELFPMIENPKVEFVEGTPGITGTPGLETVQDPDGSTKLATEENHGVRVTGRVDPFGDHGFIQLPVPSGLRDLKFDITIDFFKYRGEPKASIKVAGTEAIGIGTFLGDIPILSLLEVSGPTFIATNCSTLYDAGLDSGIAEGFNVFGNIKIGNAEDDMLKLVGQLIGVQEIAIHAAIDTSTTPQKYILEAAIQRNVTLINGSGFKLTVSRSDLGFELSGKPYEPTFILSQDIAVTLDYGTGKGPTHLIFTGGMKLQPESVSGFFTMNGTGRQPDGALNGEVVKSGEWKPFEHLGFDALIVRQLSLQVGATYAPPWIDNVGVHANLQFGEISGSISILVDVNDADQFVFAGTLEHATIGKVLDAMYYTLIPDSLVDTLDSVIRVEMRNVKINVVPSQTSIGGVHFRDEGVTVMGEMSWWGWESSIFVNVDPYDGVIVRGDMEPLDLKVGNTSILTISGAQGEEAPLLRAKLGGEKKDDYLKLSGRATLLGLSTEMYAEADRDGFEFLFKQNWGSILETNLECKYGDDNLEARGSIDFTLNLSIDTIVGNITLVDFGFRAQAELRVGTQHGFHLSLAGGFHVYGLEFDLGSFSITIPPEDFEAVFDAVVQEIRDALGFDNFLEFAKAVGKQVIKYAGKLAEAGKELFEAGVREVTAVYKSVGKAAEELAKDLAEVMDAVAEEVAEVLNEIYELGPKQAVAVLEGAFQHGERAAAVAMKAAGYVAEEVGEALEDTYRIGEQGVAAAMEGAGYAASETAKALESAFGMTGAAAETVLNGAGYAASEAASAVGGVASDVGGAAEDVVGFIGGPF